MLFKIIFQCKCVFFFTFIYFQQFHKRNAWRGNERSGTAVFRDNSVAICTHDRRLWIWIGLYPWISMDISMDIHGKSVDMDMDDKFHIHGKPGDFGI